MIHPQAEEENECEDAAEGEGDHELRGDGHNDDEEEHDGILCLGIKNKVSLRHNCWVIQKIKTLNMNFFLIFASVAKSAKYF